MSRQKIALASMSLIGPWLVLSGCGPNVSGSTLVECRPLTSTAALRPAGWTGTVFTIVMENHDRTEILGNPAAPFINQLATSHAVAAGYHDAYVHPSEPNYIWMVAGENFGILNNADPGPGHTIASTSHLADQIERAGLTWKTYQESMGAPCGLRSHGLYAVKHNPFAYFDDINGWNGESFQPTQRCSDHIVDYTELDLDLASGQVPHYAFITPNLVNDMHDGSVADGDSWLSREVPKILASDAYKNGGVLFLLWDEGSGQSDDPPFIAISPNAQHGYTSRLTYDTSAFLKTAQAILGLEALPCATSPEAVPVMSDLFSVPM
jgi:phospholipase C